MKVVPTDLSGWIQAGVVCVTTALGGVFWAASANSSLHETQAQVQQLTQKQQNDHDQITAQDQKLKDIADDVSEIKGDVKTLVQKVK